MKPSFLFLCLGLCLLDSSTAEATCTATQLSECSNIIECKSGLTSCELPYALCLRRHKCPEDMYVDMLAANATYFVLSENVHLSSGYSLRSRMVTNGIKLESEVHLLADLGASAFVETHRGRPTGIALAEYVRSSWKWLDEEIGRLSKLKHIIKRRNSFAFEYKGHCTAV